MGQERDSIVSLRRLSVYTRYLETLFPNPWGGTFRSPQNTMPKKRASGSKVGPRQRVSIIKYIGSTTHRITKKSSWIWYCWLLERRVLFFRGEVTSAMPGWVEKDCIVWNTTLGVLGMYIFSLLWLLKKESPHFDRCVTSIIIFRTNVRKKCKMMRNIRYYLSRCWGFTKTAM